MGIVGLLPAVKNILRKRHIGKYGSSRLGIDGHAWIHQVIPMIAVDLYYNRPTDKHVLAFMAKVRNLLDYGIEPIFVFDGDFLQSKEKTFIERREQREKAKAEVEFYLNRNEIKKAREIMKRCASVTPTVLYSIIRALKASGIEYIISPYEADAQLYFLQRICYIDYILTEDSDLIVYGAKKILYKFSGSHVQDYDSKSLHLCRDRHFQENILEICILSGCDYLGSIKGVGLVTAHKKLKEAGNVKRFVDMMISLSKEVPENYLEQFNRAKATFLHHIVYNPLTKKRQFLIEPPLNYEFLGTLENVPFRILNYTMERHFSPNVVNTVPVAKAVYDTPSSMDDFILDSSLSLPYFK